MSRAVEYMTQLASNSLNLMTFSWWSGSLWPMSLPPNISQSAKPWKASFRLVTWVICSRDCGSDR